MKEFNVSSIDPQYNFCVSGFSYIGEPRNGTVLFATSKMQQELNNLRNVERCLAFVEKGMIVPDEVMKENCIVFSDKPEHDYGMFSVEIKKREMMENEKRRIALSPGGYYIGENVEMGSNCVIEPGCIIGHDVSLGNNVYIGFGSAIYNSRIGDNFTCQNHTVIGVDSFFISEGEDRIRIPSFGEVYIGNQVDLGSNVVIERGFNDNTTLEDGIKIDANSCVGHDAHIGKGTVICCGVCVAGLVKIGNNSYVGMGSTIKQRLRIGDNSFIGMGAVVISSVREGQKVFGNPATKLKI